MRYPLTYSTRWRVHRGGRLSELVPAGGTSFGPSQDSMAENMIALEDTKPECMNKNEVALVGVVGPHPRCHPSEALNVILSHRHPASHSGHFWAPLDTSIGILHAYGHRVSRVSLM